MNFSGDKTGLNHKETPICKTVTLSVNALYSGKTKIKLFFSTVFMLEMRVTVLSRN
jgi:hypothetical protein